MALPQRLPSCKFALLVAAATSSAHSTAAAFILISPAPVTRSPCRCHSTPRRRRAPRRLHGTSPPNTALGHAVPSSLCFDARLYSGGASEKASGELVEPNLATVRRRFQPGDYYVWLYRDDTGTPTSYERYQIIADDATAATDANDAINKVVIEMATKFDAQDEYVVHHRMTVDLRRHLLCAADDRGGWTLDRFEYRDAEKGEWITFGEGDNVQAFEEKFDVFAMPRVASNSSSSSSSSSTQSKKGEGEDDGACCCTTRREESSYRSRNATVDFESTELIRSDRHSYTGAWYGPTSHGTLSGVALAKEFKEHTFSLIAVGRDGEDETPVRVDL